MLSQKRKPKFSSILKLIKSLDTSIGIFMFRDSTAKRTIMEHFLSLTILRHAFLSYFFIVSNLFVSNFELMSIIISCSLASSIFSLHLVIIIVISQKKVARNLLRWCKNLYDEKKKYHKKVEKIALEQLVVIEHQTYKLLNGLRMCFYFDGTILTFGFPIVGIFLPDNIVPKFTLPIPMYLPFTNQNTWLAFLTTLMVQINLTIDTATLGSFLYGIGFNTLMHITGYLDIIKKTIQNMKEEMLTNRNECVYEPKLIIKPILNLDTLAIIDASLDSSCITTSKRSTSFDEFTLIVCEMISDVNSIITTYAKFWRGPFFLNEIACLGSLFICGLIFTVIRQQYFFAVGLLVVCCLFFGICYINEQILEKLDDINEALYDLPWYNLNPNQRRTLMILMQCNKIQNGLTSAEMHNVTFERFGIILKAGYTNLLILKDLVQK